MVLNRTRTFSLSKPQGTELATTCGRASLRSIRARLQVRGLQQLLGKGRTATFRTHISPPAGQSSPALLLAVLLGEERSALLMAMNSSRLFIQPSSACWLQPQPAPPHGMTPPGNNALPGNSPLRLSPLRDTSAAPLRSLPSPLTHSSEHPLLQRNGINPARPGTVTPREQQDLKSRAWARKYGLETHTHTPRLQGSFLLFQCQSLSRATKVTFHILVNYFLHKPMN